MAYMGNLVSDAWNALWGPQGALNFHADNPASLNASVDAVYRALVARQSYVNSTHPELLPKYTQLRAQGLSNWTQSRAIIASPGNYSAEAIHNLYANMLPWMQQARQFVDTCDAMYQQEQTGMSPQAASAIVAANPPPIRGNVSSGFDLPSLFSSVSGNLKWLALGVGALVLLPPLLNMVKRRG